MPIRDIIVVGLVLLLVIYTLRRPWLGIMNWTWVSIMSPHRYCWGFAYSAPLAQIAGISAIFGLLISKERRSPFQGAPPWWLLVFAFWVTISWLLGVDPVEDYPQWDKVMKVYLMSFVALMLLHNKLHIMTFAWVTIGSLAVLAAKGGLFTLLNGGGGRVWGPPGSFISDNNHFALAVIVSIPMLHFLQMQVNEAWKRHAFSVVILLSVACALGSYSRGALLALASVGAVFWWRTPKKGIITLLLLITGIAMLPMMPEEWWGRMDTIQDYQEDASAMGRINSWYVAWDVAKDNFFGGGMSYQYQEFFNAYGRFENTVRAAHSIYFQILGNHGFLGLFFYLAFWISTYRTARWLRINGRAFPQAKWAADLGAMAQVSLVGYAVGGAFLSMPYFDLPYNIMIMVVLARQWVTSKAWENEQEVSNSFWDTTKLKLPADDLGATTGSPARPGLHWQRSVKRN